MKKILSIFSLAFLPVFGFSQDFEITYDTASLYTEGTIDEFDILPVPNYLKNVSDVPIIFTWQFLNPEVLPETWEIQGFCDNITCYLATSPNLWVEGNPIESGSLDPGSTSDLKLQMHIQDSDENATVVFKFRVSTSSQVDTVFYLVSKGTLGFSTIAMDDNRVGVYPNPSSNISDFSIFISSELNASKIVVSDIMGRSIGSLSASSAVEVYNLSSMGNVSSGTYFVNILGKSGEMIATRKFTINR